MSPEELMPSGLETVPVTSRFSNARPIPSTKEIDLKTARIAKKANK
jgi:hypothetical protein